MKTFIPYFRRMWIAARVGSFFLLCSALSGSSSLAATVTWSGAGGDDLWSNPLNWNGGALPTSDDDVVINVPGEVTVRMDAYATTVRSLQCQESFFLETGPFMVTAGPSFVNGSFNMNPVQALIAEGPTTTFTAHGVVTNLAGVGASGGAVISFPNARQVEAIVWAFSTTAATRWSASGSGSVIEMVNLTNLVGVGSTYRGYDLLNATDGGRIDLHQLRSTEGDIGVGVANPASVIDLSGLEGLWPPGPSVFGLNSRLSASDGGTILIPNVTALDRVDLNISDSGNIPTAQLRSFTDGALSLSSRTNGFNGLTNFSGSISAYDSRLDWTNFTVLYATNSSTFSIRANQGSVIDLSRVTSVVVNPAYGMNIAANTGSRIDLRGLRQPDGGLYVYVSAYNSGSLVDLSGLTGLWEGNNSSVRVDDGGTVLIPNVTAMNKVSLELHGDAVVPTAQLRSFTDGYVTLSSRTNDFAGLTNFSGFLSAADTRLDLTNFTVLYATNTYVYLQASQGSFIDLSRLTNVVSSSSGYYLAAYASGGSRIDLRRLRAPDAPVVVSASEADSLVDLSGLTGLWRGGGGSAVTASTGGTVLMPNVTALDGVSLNVSDSANVNLTQLNSITAGNITLRSRTNDLSGLTNFTGALAAYDSRLYLTNLTVLYVTNHMYITADQGSLIDLSRVTNVVQDGQSLNIYAYRGGIIDLSRLPVLDGPANVEAVYEDSLVDLSGLSGLWDAGNQISVRAWSGATVAIPNVTAMRGISLDLRSDAIVPLAQLRSFTEGYIQLSAQTNVFTSLTNFTGTLDCSYDSRAEFPSLTQLNTTNYSISFSVRNGSVVDLSQVTNAVVETYSLSLYAYSGARIELPNLESVVAGAVSLTLYAYYGGRIELPNLESIVAGAVNVTAEGTDAVVDLSGLTGFFSDNNSGSLRTISGGAILLNSDAMLLAGVAIDFQGDPGGVVPPFLAPSQSLVLYGQPWQSYRIESRNPSVTDSPWSLYKRVPLIELLQIVSARPPRNLALRVHAFIADPSEVDVRLSAPATVEPVIYGVPGRTYRLETTTSLSADGWQNGPTRTLTNSFFIFPGADATNDARFYRARQL